MAATYDTSLGDNVSKVRLTIGDTDVTPASDAVFTDAELEYFLTKNSGSIDLASADAAEAWAAKYAANADNEKIGDYSYSQKIVDKMLTLAKRLRDKVSSSPAFEWSEYDLSGEDE